MSSERVPKPVSLEEFPAADLDQEWSRFCKELLQCEPRDLANLPQAPPGFSQRVISESSVVPADASKASHPSSSFWENALLRELEERLRELESTDEAVRLAAHRLEDVCESLLELGWSNASVYVLDALNQTLTRIASAPVSGLLVRSLGVGDARDQEARVFSECSVEVHCGRGFRKHYDRVQYFADEHDKYKTRFFGSVGVFADNFGSVEFVENIDWTQPRNDGPDFSYQRQVPEGYRFEPLGTVSLSSKAILPQDVIDRTRERLNQIGRIVYDAKLRSLASTAHSVLTRCSGAESGVLLLWPGQDVSKSLDPSGISCGSYVSYSGKSQLPTRRSTYDQDDLGFESSLIQSLCWETLVSGTRSKRFIAREVSSRALEAASAQSITVIALEGGLGFFCAFDAVEEKTAAVEYLASRVSHMVVASLREARLRRSKLRKLYLQEQLALLTAPAPSHPDPKEYLSWLDAKEEEKQRLRQSACRYLARVANVALSNFGADVVSVVTGPRDHEFSGFLVEQATPDFSGARSLLELFANSKRPTIAPALHDGPIVVAAVDEEEDPRRSYRLLQRVKTTFVAVCKRRKWGLVIDFRRPVTLEPKDCEQLSILVGLCIASGDNAADGILALASSDAAHTREIEGQLQGQRAAFSFRRTGPASPCLN